MVLNAIIIFTSNSGYQYNLHNGINICIIDFEIKVEKRDPKKGRYIMNRMRVAGSVKMEDVGASTSDKQGCC